MSHPKDIDQRAESAADADELMLVDLLYGDLDAGARQRTEQRVREDDALAGELEALTRIRSIMRELPDEEPPEVISTKLLHAAAAAAGSRAAVDEEQPSLWARLRRLFMPLMMHPGLAAAASLVLVGGVAGALYLSGDLKMAAVSHERAPAMAAAPQQDTTTTPEGAFAGTPPPVTAVAPAEMANAAPPPAAGAELDGLVDTEATGYGDGAEGRGTSGTLARGRAQAAEPAQDPRRSDPARRPPGNTELPADDDGALEQGYFAQVPEEAELAQPSRDKGGGGVAVGGDLDDQVALGKDTSRRTRGEAKQKKEMAADQAQNRSKPASKLDELSGELDTGSSAGAGARSSAPGKTQSASGGAAAVPPALAVPPEPAPSKAPARKPSPARVAAPPPAAERAPEPSTADAVEDAPAERKPADEKASKERERRENTAAQASALHQQALAAAARGDCATVSATIAKIRSLDPAYHRDRVARDARLQECMAARKKK
jgi:hypothetical protein